MTSYYFFSKINIDAYNKGVDSECMFVVSIRRGKQRFTSLSDLEYKPKPEEYYYKEKQDVSYLSFFVKLKQ